MQSGYYKEPQPNLNPTLTTVGVIMYTIEDIIEFIENQGTLLLESEKQRAISEFDGVVSPHYRTYAQDVLEFLGM